jgi:hypothetical protein
LVGVVVTVMVMVMVTHEPEYVANPFKKERCKECGHGVRDHRPEAVSDADILTAIAQAQGAQGGHLIIPALAEHGLGTRSSSSSSSLSSSLANSSPSSSQRQVKFTWAATWPRASRTSSLDASRTSSTLPYVVGSSFVTSQ